MNFIKFLMQWDILLCIVIVGFGILFTIKEEMKAAAKEDRLNAFEVIEQIAEEHDLSAKERKVGLRKIQQAITEGLDSIEITVSGEPLIVQL